MTFIQNSIVDSHQVPSVSQLKKKDINDGFEAVLDALETHNCLNLNKSGKRSENLIPLASDINVSEIGAAGYSIEMLMTVVPGSDQIQSNPVNLTQVHDENDASVGILALRKSGLKRFEIDGKELDPSMIVSLIKIEEHPKQGVLGLSALNGDVESGESSINLKTYEAMFPGISDKAALTINASEETSVPLSILKDVVSHDNVVEFIPTAQSISNLTDKSAINLRARLSEIQSHDDDKLMDDCSVVSIALKRDPVMHSMPVNKADLDPAPKNESLTVDQTAVSKPKISDDITQGVKPTESKKESLEFDSEEAESLLESNVKEVNLKTAQTPVTSESSDVSIEVNISKSVPTQQIQQAILDAKEGVLSKESKTLTVVLNPEELGVVNVELRSDEMGKLHAVLSVEKRETLDVLQHDLHQLKAVLKEIGIDESSISLQLSSNNEHGQQKQSEYVAWEEREQMLMRFQQSPVKAAVEKAIYPERQSLRRLDIKA